MDFKPLDPSSALPPRIPAHVVLTVIDPEVHRRAKARNLINTWLIVGGLIALLAMSAWTLFGVSGVIWSVSLGVLVALITPRISPAMVLRLFKAQSIEPQEAPQLSRVLAILAERAELPEFPKLYYVASSNMNAFALGNREESAIAITDGLLRGLNLRPLAGVLGHEVSHIANEDLRVMGLADVLSRLTGIMQSTGLILMFLGLWHGGGALLAAVVLILATIGTFLQLALSRSREFNADLGAVQLTGDPIGLASALKSLERKQGSLWESILLPGGRTPDPSWLRTHPKTEDRVDRLLELRDEPTLDITGATVEPLPFSYTPVTRSPRYRILGLWY